VYWADHWLGVGKNFELFAPLLQHLRNHNIEVIYDACIGLPQPRGCLGWKSVDTICLPAKLVEKWDNYIGRLCKNFISMDEEANDTLCWSKNTKDGTFTAKLGYKVWQEDNFEGPKKWSWGTIWKIKAQPR